MVKANLDTNLLTAIEMSFEVDKGRAALFTALEKGKMTADRQVGVDKILQLLDAYQAKDDTVALAVSIFDRWLASDENERDETAQNDFDKKIRDGTAQNDFMQCCATACFLIAMKLREVTSPALVHLTNGIWSPAHIASCEIEVMFSLNWNVHSTTGATHTQVTLQCCVKYFRGERV